MKQGIARPSLLAASVASVFALSAGQVYAAGFAPITQNGSGLGNAYAGQAAAAEDASTIFYNPAGMTYIRGRQAVGAINVLKTSVEYEDGGSTPPPAQNPAVFSGDGGDAGGWAGIPNGYLSWEVTPNKMWLGVGVNAPFGLVTEYDDLWRGSFWGIKSEIMAVNINPSIAWKVNEMVSVGGGINVMYFDAELSRMVNYSGAVAGLGGAGALPALASCPGAVPAGPAAGVGCYGKATVKGDDWGWGWNIGAMFNLGPATRLGLAYRSKMDVTLEGDATFDNRPPAATTGPLAPVLGPRIADGPIEAEVELPASFSVALSHQFNSRWQVLVDYTWTNWDSIQDLVIQRTSGSTLSTEELRFENSWRVGLGVNYQLDERWKLRFGTAYDTTPVEDEFRRPRLPDEDRVWVAFGAQYVFSKALAIDFGYAHEFISDANSQLAAGPNGEGSLVGKYKTNVNIVSAQVRYSF